MVAQVCTVQEHHALIYFLDIVDLQIYDNFPAEGSKVS